MRVDDLFRDGQLKRIPPSRERAEKSVLLAERYLSEAKQTLDIGAYELAIIAAYASAFHAARAILFVDGVGERSHFAICEYLKWKHKDFGEGILNTFDLYRKLRHSVAYGLDTKVGKGDGEEIIEFAGVFLAKIKAHLEI
jgi:uncharacterized protein (UPF0332 family)